LQLGEQPGVLDGDGGLVGEGPHQSDLIVHERPDLVPVDRDDPEQLVRSQHGDHQHGPVGSNLLPSVRVLRIAPDIVNVDAAPLEGGTPDTTPASKRDGILLDECSELRRDVVSGHDSHQLTVEAEDQRAFGLAQPDRVLGQRLEDGLEIEAGTADHLEQLAGRRLLLERLCLALQRLRQALL
jgi:hypothetical protein